MVRMALEEGRAPIRGGTTETCTSHRRFERCLCTHLRHGHPATNETWRGPWQTRAGQKTSDTTNSDPQHYGYGAQAQSHPNPECQPTRTQRIARPPAAVGIVEEPTTSGNAPSTLGTGAFVLVVEGGTPPNATAQSAARTGSGESMSTGSKASSYQNTAKKYGT